MTNAATIERRQKTTVKPRKPRRQTLIEISKLIPSKLNVRRHGPKQIADLVPSLEALGILQSLLVRPTDNDSFEIIAGKRRYLAAKKLHSQGLPDFDRLPCIIMSDEDDADAIEASLAENIARLPMDELDQYEAFAALITKGRSVDEIAGTFAVSARVVERRLAIAKLTPDVRRLYRRGEIDAKSLRLLTLATKQRQRAWLNLVSDPEQEPPPYWQLKQWLLGGAAISTRAALFDLADYSGDITRDLFADDLEHDGSFFTDGEQFWQLQNCAITKLADNLTANNWSAVHIVNPNERFQQWDYETATKAQGGEAFIEVEADGFVTVHKGLLPRGISAKQKKQRAAALANGEAPATVAVETDAKPQRPELSGPLANYCDLTRLAAVRLALAKKPKLALRVMLAHAITSADHWRAHPEPMSAANETIAEAINGNAEGNAFDAMRTEIATLLRLDDVASISGQIDYDGQTLLSTFDKLCKLTDAEVNRIMALVMAETLMSGTALIDQLGQTLDVTSTWSGEGNDAFFELVRDREVCQAILTDVCGEDVQRAHATATGKKMKEITRMALDGNGRRKIENWTPPWLRFPQGQYTARPLKAG